MSEAFATGRRCHVPVVISHLKCSGIANWGRSSGDPSRIGDSSGRTTGPVRLLSLRGIVQHPRSRQVDERIRIVITWSTPHPEMAGQTLEQIAFAWGMKQIEAGARLQPAGAIYHNMSEEDVRRILQHPASMIGSDGLPNDPRPHPRLWGTFPRVLGHYCRDVGIFSAGTSGAQDDRLARAAIRFGRARTNPRRLPCRPGALRPGDHPRYGHFQQPDLRR